MKMFFKMCMVLVLSSMLFFGCKSPQECSICSNVPADQESVLCNLSEKININLDIIYEILQDVNLLVMLHPNYDPDKMLSHFGFLETTLETSGGNVADMTYSWFFDKIFDDGDPIKKIVAMDILNRRLSYFDVPMPITKYDTDLLLIAIGRLSEQVEMYKPTLSRALEAEETVYEVE